MELCQEAAKFFGKRFAPQPAKEHALMGQVFWRYCDVLTSLGQ